MSSWASGAGLLLVLFGVIAFLIWVGLRAWKRIGELRTEVRASRRTAQQNRRAKEIDDEVADLSDDELNDRLRGDGS